MSYPQLVPARPDLAAAHLKGQVTADRFAEGRLYRIGMGVTALRQVPAPDGRLDSEAIYGESFTAYEEREGWAWGQLHSDGYVGYVADAALMPAGPDPTHRIIAPRSFLFPGPDLKLPPIDTLPMGALVTVIKHETPWVRLPGGFVYAAHVAPADQTLPDPAATARLFLHVPYLWGGRTALGLDCSGLTQTALTLAGIKCLRDCSMQKDMGADVMAEYRAGRLRRNDLVFWPGHVGIMTDSETLIHANAYHMRVAEEPLADAVARIAKAGLEVSACRRIGGL